MLANFGRVKANNTYFENLQKLPIYPKYSPYRWTNTDAWLCASQSYTRKCHGTQDMYQTLLLGVMACHRKTSGLLSFGVPAEKRWRWVGQDKGGVSSIWTSILSHLWLINGLAHSWRVLLNAMTTLSWHGVKHLVSILNSHSVSMQSRMCNFRFSLMIVQVKLLDYAWKELRELT